MNKYSCEIQSYNGLSAFIQKNFKFVNNLDPQSKTELIDGIIYEYVKEHKSISCLFTKRKYNVNVAANAIQQEFKSFIKYVYANKRTMQLAILHAAWDWCDEQDKSTEFMIQYMIDLTGLSHDDVVSYITSEEAIENRKP